MGFLEVLHQFETEIINVACEHEHPEIILTKTYIANSFLEFVKNLGIDEDDTYYLRRYEEEHNKNTQLSQTDFICHNVIRIQDKMDISEEYLHLYDEASEYKFVLQQKISQFENELRTIGKSNNNKKDKIIFYKKKIENRLNKSERFSNKYLIRKAWTNCTVPYFMRWDKSDFSMDIYTVQNVDIDRRYMIFFGDLPLTYAENMIKLEKENPNKYSEFFEKIIYELNIMDELNIMVENNFYIHDRMPIISAAIRLFMKKQYVAFVYLVTPQIEGLFRVLQQSIKGDKTGARGMKKLIEKMHKNKDFFEFVYFAYDFPDLRNRIAHGYVIEVDRELACEIMMDLHWIIKKIDADNQDYKKVITFLDDLYSKQDLKMKIKSLENYFGSIEGKDNLNMLKRYFEGEFNSILEWYGLTEQKKQFQETLCSEDMYLLMWNEEPLEFKTKEKMKMHDGTIKEMNVIHFNDNSLKYYDLLLLLNKYNYVPLKWYNRYLSFVKQIEVKKNFYEKIEIDYDEIVKKVEEE